MGPRRRLTIREALELSPWDKWLQHGIMPWKMLLHLLLVLFITWQAALLNQRSAAYSRAVGRGFLGLFFPKEQNTADPGAYRYYIYTINETIQHAHKLLDTYFQLPEVSVDALEVAWPNSPDCPAWADMTGFRNNGQGTKASSSNSNGCSLPLPVITLAYHAHEAPAAVYTAANASSPWPLQVGGQVDGWLRAEAQGQNLQQLRDFFDALRSVTFDFALRSRGWGGGGLQAERETCILWSLSFLYDLSVGGQFIVSVAHRPLRRCAPLPYTDQYIVMCLLIAALAFVYELLLIKSGIDKYRIFKLLSSRTRPPSPPPSSAAPTTIHEGSPLLLSHTPHHKIYHSMASPTTEGIDASDTAPTGGRPVVAAATVAAAASSGEGSGWEALTWWDKMEILNVWTLVAMAGNVCALVFAMQAVAARDDLMVDASLRVLIGLACLLLWLAIIMYLEYEPRYFTLVLTIRRAIPRIGQFLVGILPMFVGYCLLGTILFGDRTEYFGSLSRTAATLFCVVNGDSIKLVLDSVSYVPVVGALYIVVYLCLFAYVCLMTMIAIVEESFFSSAEYSHLIWTGGLAAHEKHHQHHHHAQPEEGSRAGSHHEPVFQPLLEEAAAGASVLDLPISIASSPLSDRRRGSSSASSSSTSVSDLERGGSGGHRSTSPLRHAPTPLRPPATTGGGTFAAPLAPGQQPSDAATTPHPPPPPPLTASPIPAPLSALSSASPGPASAGAFPLRDAPASDPGGPVPMKRSGSSSRVMSQKLKTLLQAVEASELGVATGPAPPAVEGGRSVSASPTMMMGGGSSAGGRWSSATDESGGGGNGAPSAAAVAEALDDLQAQLLRQMNVGAAEGAAAVEGGGDAAAVLQAIAATKERLLLRRRRAPSSRLAPQPEEQGEEEEKEEGKAK